MNQMLTKSFVAGGTIGENRLVKPGGTAGQVVLATAASDKIIGVCRQPGGVVTGDRVDVDLIGITNVVLGGTVAAGDPITSDAAGAGVLANPAAGANVRAVGFAYEAGVSGDINRVLLSQHTMQG